MTPTRTIDPALLTPWTRMVLDLLSDGEWHVARDVVFDARVSVPPGRAWRTATRHTGPDTAGWSESRKRLTLMRGQMETVRYVIKSMVVSGRLEQRGTGRAREIRLAP